MTGAWIETGMPALARVSRGRGPLVPWALVLGAAGFFVYWFPILTAAELSNEQAFLWWAWTEGWR